MRVDNEEHPTRVLPVGIDKMKIVNAAGNEFEPIEVKGAGWAYEPAPLGNGAVLPIPDTPAYVGPIRGGLILFRMPLAELDNRPLEPRDRGPERRRWRDHARRLATGLTGPCAVIIDA